MSTFPALYSKLHKLAHQIQLIILKKHCTTLLDLALLHLFIQQNSTLQTTEKFLLQYIFINNNDKFPIQEMKFDTNKDCKLLGNKQRSVGVTFK